MSDQITLSEDRLRAILAEFKLDLIERLTRELARKADLAHVDQIEKRLDTLESHGSRDAREALELAKQNAVEIGTLNVWKYRLAGATGLITVLVAPICFFAIEQILK